MKDKVLVLGGGGLLGRNIVRVLEKRGYKTVIPASRSINGADITNPGSTENLIKEADCVINTAGLVAFLHRDRDKLININYKGALNVLRLCEKHEKKMVHISSVAAFGVSDKEMTEESIFDEEQYSYLAYAYSKYKANPEINKSPCNTNIIFPPLIIGPGDKNTRRFFDIVKDKKSMSVPGGTNAYIDVRDLAEGVVRVMEKAKNKENYIISSENFTLDTMFKCFAKALGQDINIRKIPNIVGKAVILWSKLLEWVGFKIPSDSIFFSFQKRSYSSAKIQQDLKFSPKYKLLESLKWVADSDRLLA